MSGNVRQSLFAGTNREFEIVFDQLEFVADTVERITGSLRRGNFAFNATCDCGFFCDE
jgi:hypothetical protein